MNDVICTEKTEIEGTYCPIVNGKCRLECKFLVDIEDGCMIEQIHHNMVEIIERMGKKDEAELEQKTMYLFELKTPRL